MTPVRIRLKELRLAQRLTQDGLAKAAGVRRATVNRIENAKVTSIDLDVLDKLARALGVPAAVLFEEVPNPPAPIKKPRPKR
jgi:transcriptional regulator with XRE-family HTH domain